MRHYSTIESMIADIENDAEHYALGASLTENRVTAANTRGYAAAYRDIANRLRLTVIGPDLGSAKELVECR